MAWRIDEQVVRGEIDSRHRGRVTGKLWLAGRDEVVELELEGNPWRDLAGHVLRFTNPEPQVGSLNGFAKRQVGVVGDITASRKVKVPDVSEEEFLRCFEERRPFPWHWSSSLYLEWFSERNGRVVIESTDYQLELEPHGAWTMDEAEEAEQQVANARALTTFMERLAGAAGAADPDDDDEPQSVAEAEADAEAARMDTLLDRMMARMDWEGPEEADFEKIFHEERERLRRERGEPEEKPPTPEQLAERQAWIDEINAATEEAIAEAEADQWKDEDPDERDPLVEHASDLAVRIRVDIKNGGWLPEGAVQEHPLLEIIHGITSASAKLAGALDMTDDEWPPDALIAGNVLVRLKKARGHLRDALGGLDSAEEEKLAPMSWCAEIRHDLAELLGEVQDLIREVREVLADGE